MRCGAASVPGKGAEDLRNDAGRWAEGISLRPRTGSDATAGESAPRHGETSRTDCYGGAALRGGWGWA